MGSKCLSLKRGTLIPLPLGRRKRSLCAYTTVTTFRAIYENAAVLFFPQLPSRFISFRNTGFIPLAGWSWDDLQDGLERLSTLWIRVSFFSRFQD